MSILPSPLLKLVLHWSFHVIFYENHDKNVRKFPSYFYLAFAQIKFFGCDGPNRETVSRFGNMTPAGTVVPTVYGWSFVHLVYSVLTCVITPLCFGTGPALTIIIIIIIFVDHRPVNCVIKFCFPLFYKVIIIIG